MGEAAGRRYVKRQRQRSSYVTPLCFTEPCGARFSLLTQRQAPAGTQPSMVVTLTLAATTAHVLAAGLLVPLPARFPSPQRPTRKAEGAVGRYRA